MKKSKSTKKHIDVYSIVNERIIQHLEKGVIPWRQPWTNSGHPKNLITGKKYRGINVMLLSSLHYAQNYFLTFKQVKELGGKIKEGEKSCPVIYWNWIEKENGQEQTKLPLLRYYNVFNISQCEDIPQDKLPITLKKQNDPIKSCEDIISNMPNRPDIRHNEHRAYYSPTEDYINVPDAKTFIDSASYYSTLFHELVHSSGHSSRLNRIEVMGNNSFGSKQYAQEELTAEIGACYLKSHSGIPVENLDNNAAYIKNWLRKLKDDRKFIVYASAHAQKATDYILNIQHKEIELNTDSALSIKMRTIPETREAQLEHFRNNPLNVHLEK